MAQTTLPHPNWYDYSRLPLDLNERLEPRFQIAAEWTRYAPLPEVLSLSSREVMCTMNSLPKGAANDSADVCIEGLGITIPAELFKETAEFWFRLVIERHKLDQRLTENEANEFLVFGDLRNNVSIDDFERALVEAI